METALATAETDAQPLSFVVFVPGWTDEPAWSALKGSDFLKSHFVVAAGDHGYCDGAAHQRKVWPDAHCNARHIYHVQTLIRTARHLHRI